MRPPSSAYLDVLPFQTFSWACPDICVAHWGIGGNWRERAYLLSNGLHLRLSVGQYAILWDTRSARCPNIAVTSDAPGEKMDKEDLVIFNLYSNFYTSLV